MDLAASGDQEPRNFHPPSRSGAQALCGLLIARRHLGTFQEAAFSAIAKAFGGLQEERFGSLPVDAGIGDALTVDELVERLGKFLSTGHEVAFQHCADDRCISCGALADNFLKDRGHELVVFTTIPVARVNHDRGH